MKLRYLLLTFTMLLSAVQASAEFFRSIGFAEGLEQPSVMAIYQDRLGRMWFGTREGVARYDGNRMRTYKGWIKSETKDPDVWLGNDVSFIVGDGADNIYFLIDEDLIKYNLQRANFFRVPNGDKTSVLASFRDEVWYMRNDSLYQLLSGSDTPRFKLKTAINTRKSCLTLTDHHVCIGAHDGAYLVDRKTHQIDHLLKGVEIYRIFESSTKELWIGTRMDGLYRATLGKDGKYNVVKVPYLPGSTDGISSHQIRDFVEDEAGNIWFGTFNGLHKFTIQNGQYSLIQIPQYAGGLNHPSIFALYKDMSGTIWIGSYYGGVNYFNPKHDNFLRYDYGSVRNAYYSYIGEMVIDKNNHLWLSTDGGGISCVDTKWQLLQQFSMGTSNALPQNNVKSICYDRKNNNLYVATYLGGLSRYDIDSGRFYNYLQSGSPSASMPSGVIYHIKMWKGRVYISANNGFFRLDTDSQTFTQLRVPRALYEHFDIDPSGNLYLADATHVICTHVDRPEDVVWIPLEAKGDCQVSPTHVLATAGGAYIGTLGAGLYYYNRQSHKSTHFTTENSSLASDFCYNLCLIQERNILVISDKGVTCYKPTEDSFSTIDLMNSSSAANIIEGCGVLAQNGNVYIGDTKGVTVFSENEFGKEETPDENAKFYFSELWINNKGVIPGDDTGILSHALPFTDKLKLDYDQNNLIIRVALSDYGQLLSEKWFKYKLDGLDKEWIRTKSTDLYYTNLNPGKYTLHVALLDEGDNENAKEITMKLIVSPPWYNTWWAFLFYLAVFVFCLAFYVRSRISKRTLALSLEKERFEKQQIEQTNKEKLVFFTNVSHEFRTPLTLIISHIDVLLQSRSLEASLYNQILKIKKNAQRMSNLITELLEFRKLSQDYGTLRLRKADIIMLLKEIYLSFADYAQQRNIHYSFELPDTPVLCWYERRLMEKVFFNLLSNAFKYTENGGSITISGKVDADEISIDILDTGIGISEQDVPKIFARFFRGGNHEQDGNLFKGTGIGLALTKTIVEKHHGEIEVRSSVGKGSTFTVKLPLSEDVYQEDKNVEFSTEKPELGVLADSLPILDEREEDEQSAESDLASENKYTVLLVEDNEELLQVLHDLFAPYYNVYCAHNGKEGLDLTYEKSPDIVVSDVMMPEMSGTEMCMQIKSNIELCHIPVILLTALGSTEQNIDGLNRGADDYITKPFHAQLLLARVNNLLRNRQLLRKQLEKKAFGDVDLSSMNPLDRELLLRVANVIDEHLDDTNFTIPALCKELGIGRSLLYNKFNALLGITPNNFMLNHRLQASADLLLLYPDMPVTEVSDRCGFGSTTYFSQCFKKFYGSIPQNYRRENKKPGQKSLVEEDGTAVE